MSGHLHDKAAAAATAKPAFTPARSRSLQRKHACGGSPGLTGECEACRRGRLSGQGGLSAQPKLTVNQPGDRYEQEADRVAEAVMRVPAPLSQRQVEPEENESIQASSPIGRVSVQWRVEGEEEMPKSSAAAPSQQGDGQPLAPPVRSFMETHFGVDFGQVRVHTDARAAESAQAVDALAYTVGREVVFAAGQYAPETAKGRRLLAHELMHVVQQGHDTSTAGASTTSSLRVSDGGASAPEAEADRAAAAVADGRSIMAPTEHQEPSVQRQEATEEERRR